jgi:hypothetical protein
VSPHPNLRPPVARAVEHLEWVHQVDRNCRWIGVGHSWTPMVKLKRRTRVGDRHGRHFQHQRAGKVVLAEPDLRSEVRSRASRSRTAGPAGLAVQVDWVDRKKTTLTDHRRQPGWDGEVAGRPS